MGGLFASMAVKWALDKLASFLPASLCQLASSSSATATMSQDVEVLRRLERTMRRIRATLHDAEEHWDIREESAKLRLKELKELAYDAEDVVAEYEVNRCKLEVHHRSAAVNNTGSSKRKRQEENKAAYSVDAGMAAVPVELAVQAKKIIERFEEIKDYSDKFTLSENDGERRFAPDISILRKTSSVVYEKSILGREEDKDRIVEKLLPKEGNSIACRMSVLSIVGMGGLGKTTLAQLVYNDPRMRRSFDVRVWICVSEQFDVSSITKNIIISITGKKCDLPEIDSLQKKLKDAIKEKRVLLVLDDVWNERRDLWEQLCAPLSTTSLCKIIVTTRNEAVARLVQTMPLYRINCLSCDESWSLFKQVAFAVRQDNDTPAHLVEIGKNIANKCEGLPLAIKTLGSILRYENDEMRWRDVLESKLWDLEQSRNEILPALELSYKHMPMYLKRCFVALSLFPKDYGGLHKPDVVGIWKILDLLQWDGNEKEDDIGSLYFDELVQRSFLQVYLDNNTHKMHDLIHDLACFLAAEEFSRLRVRGDTPIEIPPDARYISITGGGPPVEILTATQSLRVRAIIMFPREHICLTNLEVLLLNCKKLRALSCHWSNLAKAPIPDCLKLVRHLSLGPQFITADRTLSAQEWLGGMPCGCEYEMPELLGIGQLINLHTLPVIHISRCSCSCNISELRWLSKIRELRIHGLDSLHRIEDSNEAQLQTKKHLQALELNFSSRPRHCGKNLDAEPVPLPHQQILESLRPHHGLRQLTIWCYESERYPSWVGNASFSNLTEILLFNCTSEHLPTLGELPSLKSLMVLCMAYVHYIGREFCSHIPGVKGFPSLTHLELDGMRGLSEWSEVDVGEFQRLRTLSINDAGKLKSLPPVPFLSLVTLDLSDCENLAAIPASATLRVLCISGCPGLSAVGSLPSLTSLNLRGPLHDEMLLYRLLNCHSSLQCITIICGTTTCIPLQPHSLPSLAKLRLSCLHLQYCDGLAGLTSLKELKLWGCPNLHVIPSLLPIQLQNLNIRDTSAYDYEDFEIEAGLDFAHVRQPLGPAN